MSLGKYICLLVCPTSLYAVLKGRSHWLWDNWDCTGNTLFASPATTLQHPRDHGQLVMLAFALHLWGSLYLWLWLNSSSLTKISQSLLWLLAGFLLILDYDRYARPWNKPKMYLRGFELHALLPTETIVLTMCNLLPTTQKYRHLRKQLHQANYHP